MRSKIEEHAGIQIPIYYYEDDDGNKVYDYELMTKEFETKLSELMGGRYELMDNGEQLKPEEVKHFADGFHEGRWEDDIEQNRYTHDGDGKPLKGTKLKKVLLGKHRH